MKFHFQKFSDLVKRKGFFRAIYSAVILSVDAFFFKGKNKWRYIKPFMLNPFFHGILRFFGFREGEHQIGRLRNMKKVFKLVKEKGIQGDIVEFGVYQGYSIYWLRFFRNKYGLNERKIIGIDCFEGLPESSTIWVKGKFNDTSYEATKERLLKKIRVRNLEYQGIYLIKGLFNDIKVKKELLKLTQRISVSHVDCDLGSSCDDALSLIHNLKNDESFILFDDWGCHEDEIPKSFQKYLSTNGKELKANNLLSTRLTKYFFVSKKNVL